MTPGAPSRPQQEDYFRKATEEFNHQNYPLAASLAERAIAARQGGYGGQNARILLGQILLAPGGTHRRAYDVLCLVVDGTPAQSPPHISACRKLVSASGCPANRESASLVATCCDRCNGG